MESAEALSVAYLDAKRVLLEAEVQCPMDERGVGVELFLAHCFLSKRVIGSLIEK